MGSSTGPNPEHPDPGADSCCPNHYEYARTAFHGCTEKFVPAYVSNLSPSD